MENLNAEQVKKALECCISGLDCTLCPLIDEQSCPCVLNENAIALINSQEQRIGAQDMTISELRQRAEKAEHDADRYAQKIKELTEEIERLREQNITLEQKLMLLEIDDVYVFKAKVKGE